MDMIAGIVVWILTAAFGYNAFAVYMDGQHIGYIPIQAELTSETLHEYAVMALQASHGGISVRVNEQVTIEERRVPSGARMTRGEMLGLLSRNFSFEMEALAIYVDGSHQATMRNQAAVAAVELMLQEPFFSEYTVRAEFVQDWEVKPVYVCFSEVCSRGTRVYPIDSPEIAHLRLSREVRNPNYFHTIQTGDTLSRIAMQFDVSVESILHANHIEASMVIFPGRSLVIPNYPTPVLMVRTFDHITVLEPIKMSVEMRENPTLPQGHEYIYQEGQAGLKEVIWEVVRENGFEISRNHLETTVLIEPIVEIIIVGS
ncbi:MAG: G5 domain-containing protein [Defluviitaleaceae bacterium]|nr:G5 domain-containing protein [Defluviitaleaceae bacterium]